jgi:hypothetical protein
MWRNVGGTICHLEQLRTVQPRRSLASEGDTSTPTGVSNRGRDGDTQPRPVEDRPKGKPDGPGYPAGDNGPGAGTACSWPPLPQSIPDRRSALNRRTPCRHEWGTPGRRSLISLAGQAGRRRTRDVKGSHVSSVRRGRTSR